jgi:hypothetical protein
MGYSHSHGSVFAGRIMVCVACLLILSVNVYIFRQSDLPLLKVATVGSLVWMIAGALGMCRRKNWGRALVLTILYAGSFGFFIWAIIVLGTADTSLAGGFEPALIATVLYLIISLVLTHSKHVQRLTSRAYE